MPKHLERDLGLLATTTISIGAMVGSGIFVLPGLAAAKAGPSVVLAYLLAGLIVLPAALSKAEMATALPEAGGTYLYIDRAMGPLPGTIAGLGAWFSLVFKSAFALVGLGAYLLLFVDVPPELLTYVGLGIAALLLVVNAVGVKQTGRLQAAIVSVVVLSLVGFVADGSTYVDGAAYHPFFSHGVGGLFAATGFVFVSYAGVTKIASVAEEVEDPGRNIPRAIIGSVLLMMAVYTFVVFVVVGVTPPAAFHESLTPMADAAAQFAGPVAQAVVGVVAVLALTSMANAGVLSSSRYPLAMSRDSLAPARFGAISERFGTPVAAIAFTGLVLAVLVAFVPVGDLAKLASAFQILVFAIINVALVAFRESELDWYAPEFVAPGYPWVQGFGVLGSALLLTQMGLLPLAGAAGIVVAGVGWYLVYGRAKTEREGAARDAVRRFVGRQTLTRTERAGDADYARVLVVVDDETPAARLRALAELGAAVADADGALDVVKITTVPEQTTLSSVATQTDADRAFERTVADTLADAGVEVVVDELVTHRPNRAALNRVAETDADALFGAWEPGILHAELLGRDVDWYVERADCDVGFLRDRGTASPETVTVLVEPGIYDAAKVSVASALAAYHGATLRFATAVDADASDDLVAAVEDVYETIAARTDGPVEWTITRTDDRIGSLVEATREDDLVVLGITPHSRLYTLLFGDVAARVSDRVAGSALLVAPDEHASRPLLRKGVERAAFGAADTPAPDPLVGAEDGARDDGDEPRDGGGTRSSN
ncbi:MAG: amino acid permease [Halarchaeum sp.]